MANKKQRPDEQELRNKIQSKLEEDYRKHKARQKTQKKTGKPAQETAPEFVDEIWLRHELANEIASRYPEFIRCENHLNEIRWLTPLELERDYEFYPTEESRWSRFKKLLGKKEKLEDNGNAAIKQHIEKLRPEIEAEVKKRREEFLAEKEKTRQQLTDDLERKIYEEEMDRFYRSKQGYRKYKNHLGETKWMTKEEYLAQDEYFEVVLTPRQLFLRRSGIAAVILLTAGFLWWSYSYYSAESDNRAYLKVNMNESRALLYVDKNLAVGFRANEPYPLEAGEHEVSVLLAGFEAAPKIQRISVGKGDTVTVNFHLQEIHYENSGVVEILSATKDAAVLVNGEFQGTLANQNYFVLPAGDYTITLEKRGYASNPPQRIVRLQPGDTLKAAFSLRPRSSKNKKAAQGLLTTGLVEVRSNVKNADILLDGQPTGFQTDYVLQRIPFGKHLIRLTKKGYTVYPEEQMVKISSKQKRAVAAFTLTSLFRQVTLQTVPVEGVIFVDGKKVGEGRVKLSLPLGRHQLDFSAVPQYKKPQATSLNITKEGTDRFVFNYRLNYKVSFLVDKVLPGREQGSIARGYLLNDDLFRQSIKVGPEIKENSAIQGKVWSLGFAFQYRNPPGQDALIFNFNIPNNVDLTEPLYLKVYGYQSRDDYPLVIKGKAYYRIDVNNMKLRKEILPKYKEEQIGEERYDAFLINEFLHPGFNRIMIATTKSTTARLTLWKVVIQ